MAPGVQLSAPYEFIGGPRETGARRRNYVTNPAFDVDSTGWSTVAGTTLVRAALSGAVRPYAALGTRTAGGGSGIWAQYALTLPAAGRYALSAYINNAAGNAQSAKVVAASFAGSSTVVAANVAAAGAGWVRSVLIIDAVAGDLVGSLNVEETTTATNTNTILITGVSAVLLEPGTTWVPRYFDGESPGYYWTGTAGLSASDQDGARAVLNDTADPDFVGYVPEDGITGLAGAEIRESFADNVEADGAIHGEFYQSRRPVTASAFIGGNVTPTVRNVRLGRWQAATRALRQRGTIHREGTMIWQADGMTEPLYLRFRRQTAPQPTGGYAKTVPVGLIAADPRIYTVEPERFLLVGSGSGTAGRTYNRSYDVNYDWGPSRGIISPNNLGDADAPVVITIIATSGTSATLAVQNETTAEEVSLNGQLLVNEKLIIDTYRKTVTHVTAALVASNAFDRVELPRTRWWGLAPGPNQVNLLAGTMGAGLQMFIDWRHASA